jgi:hypothetical protein
MSSGALAAGDKFVPQIPKTAVLTKFSHVLLSIFRAVFED